MDQSWGKLFRELIETVIIALILALLIRSFVVESFLVQGSSMEPTLHDGERLLVNKLAYRLGDLSPGDIIVFRYPKDPTRDFIKRIIALPGDTVELREGTVLVNNEALQEGYVVHHSHDSMGPLEIIEGEVFVLGDNRTNSDDSRFFGTVPVENIKGKAFLIYWPLQYLRWFR